MKRLFTAFKLLKNNGDSKRNTSGKLIALSLVIVQCLFFNPKSHAQPVYQNNAVVTTLCTNTNTITIPNFTVPAGNNLMIAVVAHFDAFSGPISVTQIEFNGITGIGSNWQAALAQTNFGSLNNHIYYHLFGNQASATVGNLVITLSGNVDFPGATVCSFSNVSPSGMVNPNQTSFGSGDPTNLQISTGTTDWMAFDVVFDGAPSGGNITFTPGAGQTLIGTDQCDNGTNVVRIAASIELGVVGVSETSMDWTTGGNIGAGFHHGVAIADVIPMPVELVEFRGNSEAENVLLTWETASESNNDYFAIERSTDGIEFETIGKVQGNGNTSAISSYRFLDEAPHEGASYYRLRQTDFDGSQHRSKTISVKMGGAQSDFAIWPNPLSNSNTLNVQLPEANEGHLRVMSATGQEVYRQYIEGDENTFKINLPDLPRGLYYIEMQSGNNYSTERLFIK